MQNKNESSNLTENSSIRFRAYCNSHGWEGMAREEESEAQRDLQGHKELLDEEAHIDTGIRRYSID